MLLRRITKHVKDQNWFAVGLDFIIVVFGVFIGIQLGNWNSAQALKAHEDGLLSELRRELETSITVTDQKRYAFSQVVAAGERSLAFFDSGASCETECWPVLVDFFHASQWQSIDVNRSTYDEMRRQGLPRSRAVIDTVERYLLQNENMADTHHLPAYRSLVRQMIPVSVQTHYWANCFDLENGRETYVLDCAKGASDETAALTIDKIRAHPEIEPNLTEWIGIMVSNPADLGEQNEAARHAIEVIDAELENRT